jgi:S-DNA-T family DNA segregation ATPase FtsK/SpoIIIE
LGVHVIMAGDKPSSIPPSIASSVQRRVTLRQATDDDYLMMGAPRDVLNAASPPGRGIWDDNEIQIAVLGSSSNVADQSRKITSLAKTAFRRSEIIKAPGVQHLPDNIEFTSLPAVDDRGWPVLGLADETLAPIGVEPRGSLIIAGPPGAGRTNAMVVLATSIRRAQGDSVIRVLFTPRRSSLETRVKWDVAARGEDVGAVAEDYITELDSGDVPAGKYAFFIDSVSEFSGSMAEDPLVRLIRMASRSEQFVVGESESSTWSQAYSLATPFKAARRGLILVPGEMDADSLTGTSVGRIRTRDFPPGRGFLIAGGIPQKLQLGIL